MNDRFNIRVWDKVIGQWRKDGFYIRCFNGQLIIDNGRNNHSAMLTPASEYEYIIEQCTGLKDKGEKSLFFCGDIGEFDNGDRFVIKTEDWNEFYVDWIGEPECEDQARDFYRIRNAAIIGNIHDNPELLETAV